MPIDKVWIMVTDFSVDDRASGITFCTAVHQCPRQGILYILCPPRSPKSDELARERAKPTRI